MVFALLVVGATGITAQIVLMRELLTVFLGNELSLGIILACWLALEALGSWLAGRIRPRLALFAGAVIASLLAFPAAIWFARVARPMFDSRLEKSWARSRCCSSLHAHCCRPVCFTAPSSLPASDSHLPAPLTPGPRPRPRPPGPRFRAGSTLSKRWARSSAVCCLASCSSAG